jgi:hypothetical protein
MRPVVAQTAGPSLGPIVGTLEAAGRQGATVAPPVMFPSGRPFLLYGRLSYW